MTDLELTAAVVLGLVVLATAALGGVVNAAIQTIRVRRETRIGAFLDRAPPPRRKRMPRAVDAAGDMAEEQAEVRQ